AEVAVRGLRRVQEEGGGARRGEGRRQLGADMPRLADAGDDQPARTRLDEADGLDQVVIEAVAQERHGLDFLIDDRSGSLEGLSYVFGSHPGSSVRSSPRAATRTCATDHRRLSLS